MLFPPVFRLFGWILVITTVVLFAVASFVLGGFILTSVICGAAKLVLAADQDPPSSARNRGKLSRAGLGG
jgi:hypothetical protein